MSYDITLHDEKGNVIVLEEPHEYTGGTFAVGGTTELWLNVTFNYNEVYTRCVKAFEGNTLHDILHGKRAGDVIPILEEAIEQIGTRTFDDYWAPTPGNAGAALVPLLEWSFQYPDATFYVDR